MVGSRGSVHTLGPVQLTDRRATRFWMEAADAVRLVLLCLREMRGGEIFVPKLRSAAVVDVVENDGSESGLRPGEKLHEQLISDEEAGRTWDYGDHYRVLPFGTVLGSQGARRVSREFRYVSAS